MTRLRPFYKVVSGHETMTTSLPQNTSRLQLADQARKCTLRLIELKNRQTKDFMEAGKLFRQIKDNQLWQLEGAESFNSYIAEIGYDRTTAFKMMQVYETFGSLVDSNQQLQDAGWVKLAKVAPHTNENNIEVMVELATSNSLSDIDKELVRQHYIVKTETESQFVTCPFCNKDFIPHKRQDQTFKQEEYNKVIESYKTAKETEFSGKEYDPIMQAIKTMFINGRTTEQIIATIEWLKDNAEYEWTINTVKNKIAEILPQTDYQPKKEVSEQDKNLLRRGGVNI